MRSNLMMLSRNIIRRSTTQLTKSSIRPFSFTAPKFTPDTDTLINQSKVKGLMSPKVCQPENSAVITLSCQDKLGVVKNVSEFLYNKSHNILSSDQFLDPTSKRFFMRITTQSQGDGIDIDKLKSDFSKLADEIGLEWHLHETSKKPKVLIMVSKIGRKFPLFIVINSLN